MVYKLKVHAKKGRWEHGTIDGYFPLLVKEVDELREAIALGNTVEIVLEGADVANFAMILAAMAVDRGNMKIEEAKNEADRIIASVAAPFSPRANLPKNPPPPPAYACMGERFVCDNGHIIGITMGSIREGDRYDNAIRYFGENGPDKPCQNCGANWRLEGDLNYRPFR